METTSPDRLRARLDALMAHDASRLARRLDGPRRGRRGAGDRPDALAAIAVEVEAAERRVERRRAAVPLVGYPAGLPITERLDDLRAALADHQVVVVAGETGSGKSTQLPKLCLELGRGVRGWIGHTQPRRLAARTIAERVAEELGGEVGGAVGYAVRFTDRVGDDTLVKVMTDGILLAEVQRDRELLRYDTIILDEAHERSLNIDFLLGYLTQLLPRRPDLKLIVTSATIDTERFSRHFGGAPVVEVSGRTFPVEVRYRPVGEEPGDDRDQTQAVVDGVEELLTATTGDVLVFLSGEREIHDAADALRRARPDVEVLPLYARLSANEQHRVFRPHAGRRVVLATNVAETSLTVPGIRSVVDAGTARISRYSRRLKVQRLPIEPVSRASADQRAGRCGRVAPGVCVRLYAEEDLAGRPAFTEPEILRTNLASVILQMTALGLGDVAAFPFVDPPDSRAVKDGVALLEELGAVEPGGTAAHRVLTPVGRRLAQLPVDPRLGRMVIEAGRLGCVREVTVIAAALSIQDPRERPADQRAAADELHRRFLVPGSDPMGLVALWDHLRARQQELSSNQFRKLCRNEFLHHLRVREWQDLYSQLRRVASSLGITPNATPAPVDHVHQALLAGLLSHVGVRDGETKEYRGARGARFAIAPGSALAGAAPRWVVAAELVETNRLWGRVVARIQPEWLERLGGHLLKHQYGDPRWDVRRGAAMTTERVTLYGLPVVTARPVPWARVDPAGARDMFVQHALVEGDWEGRHPFLDRNRDTIAAVRRVEDRARRRDVLVGDDVVHRFYADRIGPDVASGRHFDGWWKQARRRDPALLDLTREVLVRPGSPGVDPEAFPDTWTVGDLTLPLSYVYEPGAQDDGVTVHLPLLLLDEIDPDPFEWQVPGHRCELVTALLRTLPKPVRRHVLPAADHATAFLAAHGPTDGPLRAVLAREVSRTAGEPVAPSDLVPAQLPLHLRVRFLAEDALGDGLAASRDLRALRRHLAPAVRAALAAASPVPEQSGLTDWPGGTIPRTVPVKVAGRTVTARPALVDEGATVGLRVLADAGEQRAAMLAGTRRLLLLAHPGARTAVERLLRNDTKLALARTPGATTAEVVDDCVAVALDDLVAGAGGPAWDEAGFTRLRDHVRASLPPAAAALARTAGEVVGRAAVLRDRLATLTGPGLVDSVADVGAQLSWLVGPGFVTATGSARLAHLVRYLDAIERRLGRLAAEPGRDSARMRPIQRLEDDYADLLARRPELGPVAAPVRWMIEELRVSVFAQSLGTPGPVSEQRIRRELERLATA